MNRQLVRAAVAAVVATVAPLASAHDFRCEKTACVVPTSVLTGLPILDPTGLPSCAAPASAALTIDHYPVLVGFRVDLTNLATETSVVTGVFDPLLGTSPLTFGATIEPGFAVSVGGTGTEVFVVPVASREACLALFGGPPVMEPAACTSVVENRFMVEHDVGSAECRARVVCGEEQQPAPPLFTLTPAAHDFGPVPVGSTTAPFAFTATNVGGSPGGISLTILASTGDFGLGSSGCGLVAPGATCSVFTAFTPTAVGPRAMTFGIVNDATGNTDAVGTVTGTGLPAPPAAP